MNPGAAGKFGIHRVRTLLRFVLDAGDIRDLEVVELGKTDSFANVYSDNSRDDSSCPSIIKIVPTMRLSMISPLRLKYFRVAKQAE